MIIPQAFFLERYDLFLSVFYLNSFIIIMDSHF
jgi:hypothetical protein